MANPVKVEIDNSTFPPVSIPKGPSVVWRNKDPVVHSAEMDREAEPYFNVGALHPGETSSPVSFPTPGTYDYLCRYHHGMRADHRDRRRRAEHQSGARAARPT